MSNKRHSFRIRPETLTAHVQGHEVILLDISLGGAKFKTDLDIDLGTSALILSINETKTIGIHFKQMERIGGEYRVIFTKLNRNIEATLSKYIIEWQRKRFL